MSGATEARTRKVALIGWGAIGRTVGGALAAGEVPGAELAGIVDNRPLGDAVPAPQLTVEQALAACDLIVEAAGQGVVREWGETILASGTDLLVASTGALTDEELSKRLLAAGPGRVYFTGGAVGGLDLLQAVRAMGPLGEVTLTTTSCRPPSNSPGWTRRPWPGCGPRPRRWRSCPAPPATYRSSSPSPRTSPPRWRSRSATSTPYGCGSSPTRRPRTPPT